MKDKPKLAIPDLKARGNIHFPPPQSALARWDSGLRAAEESDNTISILDVIGYDWWTGEGVTAKRIAGALRKIGGGQDVEVVINSPGGDLFEGLAIYNLLREHDGRVTVKVISLAASAASIIAMAGDEIQIARAGFMMIHDTWIVAIGNRHDMNEFAEWLEPFDRAMADVYAVQTGMEQAEIMALMDAETWIGGSEAVERGFADSLLPSDQVQKGEATAGLRDERRLEAMLRSAGASAQEAKTIISRFKGAQRDAGAGRERDATERGQRDAAALERVKAGVSRLSSIGDKVLGV